MNLPKKSYAMLEKHLNAGYTMREEVLDSSAQRELADILDEVHELFWRQIVEGEDLEVQHFNKLEEIIEFLRD